jgi:hypothetical protein
MSSGTGNAGKGWLAESTTDRMICSMLGSGVAGGRGRGAGGRGRSSCRNNETQTDSHSASLQRAAQTQKHSDPCMKRVIGLGVRTVPSFRGRSSKIAPTTRATNVQAANVREQTHAPSLQSSAGRREHRSAKSHGMHVGAVGR